jgi:predicted transcriptional regulator
VRAKGGKDGCKVLRELLMKGRKAVKASADFDWLGPDGWSVLEQGALANQLKRLYDSDTSCAPAVNDYVMQVLDVCCAGLIRDGECVLSVDDLEMDLNVLRSLMRRGSRHWLREVGDKFVLSLWSALAEPVERMILNGVEATTDAQTASHVFAILSREGAMTSKALGRKVLQREAEVRQVLNRLIVDGWVSAIAVPGDKKHVHHMYKTLSLEAAARLLLQKSWSTLHRGLIKLESLYSDNHDLIDLEGKKRAIEMMHGKVEEIYSMIVVLNTFLDCPNDKRENWIIE